MNSKLRIGLIAAAFWLAGITGFAQGNFFWSHTGAVEVDTIGGEGRYGFLYNTYVISSSKDIAPAGLRVASENDYNTLITYVQNNYAGTVNNALKAEYDWPSGDNGSDIYNFEALPAGRRAYDGFFQGSGDDFEAWTTTWDVDQLVYFGIDLFNDTPTLYSLGNLTAGMSIRCMRDLTSTEISNYSDGQAVETITDYDGNQYYLIKIGNQGWTHVSLEVSHFNDGTVIPNNLSDTEWENTTEPAYALPPRY